MRCGEQALHTTRPHFLAVGLAERLKSPIECLVNIPAVMFSNKKAELGAAYGAERHFGVGLPAGKDNLCRMPRGITWRQAVLYQGGSRPGRRSLSGPRSYCGSGRIV